MNGITKKYSLINEVHDNAIKNLEEEDKDITEKKRVINEQLEMVQKKMDYIKDNAKAVTEEIQTILERALDSSREIIAEKTD